jgi:hypothetical protein
MRKIRDIFYINANFDECYFTYYGMEFHEFVRFCPIDLKNILITDGDGIADSFNYTWFFENVKGRESILELSRQDIYGLGNFHWLDYDNETDLNNCTPEEMAEVLYLSHFGKPIKSPFFDRINNNFVYLAHDDGWFCKLYCKDNSIIKEIIANKILDAFRADKRRKIHPMDEEIKKQLFEFIDKGLLIDFLNIWKDDKGIYINFYTVGSYEDMDEMYNNLEQNKKKARAKGYIQHKNKTWKIREL